MDSDWQIKIIIIMSLLTLFEVSVILGAARAVSEIGLSLEPNVCLWKRKIETNYFPHNGFLITVEMQKKIFSFNQETVSFFEVIQFIIL